MTAVKFFPVAVTQGHLLPRWLTYFAIGRMLPFFTAMPACPHSMAGPFPRASDPRESKEEDLVPFMTSL